MILQFFAQIILFLLRWKPILPETEKELLSESRAIAIFPHTSKWDSVIFGLYFLAKPNLFDSTYTLFAARFFKGPLKLLLNFCNCIPIENRKKNQGQFGYIKNFLSTKEKFKLFLSPKGSSDVRDWRTGYSRLATALKCPIIVCGLDYQKRRPIITGIFGYQECFTEKDLKMKMKLISSLYPQNEPTVYLQ